MARHGIDCSLTKPWDRANLGCYLASPTSCPPGSKGSGRGGVGARTLYPRENQSPALEDACYIGSNFDAWCLDLEDGQSAPLAPRRLLMVRLK